MEGNPFKKIVSKSKPYVAAGLALVGSVMPMIAHSQNNHKAQTEQTKENNKGVFTKEYKSDSVFYRATAKGESPDIATAQKIAEFNSSAKIAQETDSSNVTETQLSNLSTIEHHLFQNPDGSYTYWVAVEVAK